MKVSEIMRKKVITCHEDTPVKEVARKLVENNITGMPVVKGQEIVGIVTEADLIMQRAKLHMPSYIQLLSSFLYLEDPGEVEEELKKILATKASELMTPEVVTVDPDYSVEDVASLIEEEHINPVPVVRDETLVGIVSREDIVKLLIRE
ncbi:MAG: CBS domain-containing protein [Parcubacteria group bacterium]|nr:CBS domain-containing protein [Parcubacteria group bacterium]